mmetsp:Transcript_35312/g.84355  ORF Transcript_35312/g.84355 Transcript_35312/m.84355 type:complete len:639 (-) Transcript_35312:175-2091(-)
MTYAHIPVSLVCLLLVVPVRSKSHCCLSDCQSPPLQEHHAQAPVTHFRRSRRRNARPLSSTAKLAFVSSSPARTTTSGPSDIEVKVQTGPLLMHLSATNPSKADEANEEECSLQNLFKEVQQNDSQWYDQVFASLVDEDEADAALRAACSTDDGFLVEGQSDSSQIDTTNGQFRKREEKVEEQSHMTAQVDDEESDEKPGTPLRSDTQVEDLTNSFQIEEVLNIDDDQPGGEGESDRGIDALNDERIGVTSEPTSLNTQPTDRVETRKLPKQETDKQQPSQQSIRTLVLRNKFTNDVETLAPVSTVEDLGYTEKEINVLKPQVLELIIEDEIKRPSKGLPKRWVRLGKLEGFRGSKEDEKDDFDYGWEVEINQGCSPINGKAPEEEPPRAESWSSVRSQKILSAKERPNGAQEYNFYYDEDQKLARNRRRRRRNTVGPISDRQRPRRQRDLRIDRNIYDDDDEIPPNRFWMDLPTFRDFLRKEAQMRIKILGPDWKETVLDESRWRYDLYKTWLVMLDEGVGENPLYADRPDPSRRARPPRRRKDITDKRRDERPRRPRRSSQDSMQFTNFSDLEDSLTRSIDSKRGSGDFEVENDHMIRMRRESSDRSIIDDGYPTEEPDFDYEQESPPRRRRRRTR